MPILADFNNCTGCTACEAICPKSAISMIADGMGFKFPQIDPSKCIECKLCEKNCPVINARLPNNGISKTYAAQLYDKDELMNSQSGGAFYAIARLVIQKGGVVYGAGYNIKLDVCHQRAADYISLENLRYSKYVQSDMSGVFRMVLQDLKSGLIVLFSGTPCQIAGLLNFVPLKLQKLLFTVDIVCHGVPSPEVYKQYREYLSKKYNQSIKKFIFRDKRSFGWRTARESIIFKNGKQVSSYSYNYLFLESNLITRKACSLCKFCSVQRVSDITIADCWGWEKIGSEKFSENNGISLTIINTEKGDSIFRELRVFLDSLKVSLDLVMQHNLKEPTLRPKLADCVAEDFSKYGFEYIHHKYGYTLYNRGKALINRCVNKIFRIIKKS